MHPPLVIHWPYAVVYWGVFIWAYSQEWRLTRRSRRMKSTQDAGSYLVLILIPGLAVWTGFAIAYAGRHGALGRQHLWFYAGLGVMMAGSLLRRHCFRMLGESFTALVMVRPGQQVVHRGAYRWIRHPSYTAGMLLFAGTMLALGNWLSVAIVLGISILSYLYRVRVEERALVETLGDPYRAYMQRTKRFIPGIL